MTNLQLYFTLGLPVLFVLVGILLNQYGLGRLERRIDRLEDRMDKLDARMLQMDKDWEERFRKSEEAAERRNERILEAISKIQLDMREFYRTLGQHEVRLGNLEK